MITRHRFGLRAPGGLSRARCARNVAIVALIISSTAPLTLVTPAAAQGSVFSAPRSASDDLAGARSVSTVDLDQDGDLDLVATTSGNAVAWFENTAGDASTFSKHLITNVDGNGPAHDVGDIDGDGVLDVVVAKGSVGDIFWYRRATNSATSWTKITIHEGSSFPADVQLADMDSDGDLDVAVADAGEGRLIWYANADGEGMTWIEGPAGLNASGANTLEVADLDRDGDLDLLTAVTDEDLVRWWRNDDGVGGSWVSVDYDLAPGSFGPGDPGLTNPWAVRAGDLDGDGDVDMVVNSIQGGIVRLENQGPPLLEFTVHSLDDDFGGSRDIDLVDIDQDTDLDVLAVSQGDNELVLWENAGPRAIIDTVDGWRRWTVAAGLSAVTSVDSGDLDGDGDLDLVTCVPFSTDNLVWSRNETPNGEGPPEAVNASIELLATPPTGQLNAMAFGDIDGDGFVDLVGGGSAPLAWWSGLGSAMPLTRTQIQGDGTVFNSDIQVADLDGDGDLDVVSTRQSNLTGLLRWWENQDRGASWLRQSLVSNVGFDTLLVADIFQEGSPRVILAGSGHDNAIRAADPLSGSNILIANHGTNSLRVGDLDQDGDLDVVAGGDSVVNDSGLLVAEQIGSGFTDHDVSETPIDDLELFDWDNDGDLDILAVSVSAEQILFYENVGTDFTFVEHDITPSLFPNVIHRYDDLLVGDFDRDGFGELWALGTEPLDPEDPRPFLLAIFQDGSTTREVTIESSFGSRIDAIDINHDGVEELMILDREAESISSLLMPDRAFLVESLGEAHEWVLERGEEIFAGRIRILSRSQDPGAAIELRSFQLRFEWRPPSWPDLPAEVLSAQEAGAMIERLRVYYDNGDNVFDINDDEVLLDLDQLPYDGTTMAFELPSGSAPTNPGTVRFLWLTITPRYSAPDFDNLYLVADAEPEVFLISPGGSLRRGRIEYGRSRLILYPDSDLLFADGFESGNTSAWSGGS